jgi:hypothetical protein
VRNGAAGTDRGGRARQRGILTKPLAIAVLAVATVACGGGEPEDDTRTVASGVAPDTLCVSAVFNGHTYWFCNNVRNWSTARSKCEAVGLNLARIDTAAENDFIRTQMTFGFWNKAWIGGSDTVTEGTWRWTFNNSRFWTGVGAPLGTPFPGMFSNWAALQPDNFINQDCAQIKNDGFWTDDSCSGLERYICESGVDLCPNDPQKVEFGVCGCGVPDVDTDGDGKLDCEEQCPNDSTKLVPGHCGCSDAPRAAGTVCRDGLCDANTQCDGAGVCGNPAECPPPPDSDCHWVVARNTYYWICNHDRQFTDARQRCQSVGTDLIEVSDAFEDDFIAQNTIEFTWLGATDQAVEGDWTWLGKPMPFWTGGLFGAPVAGAYANWVPFEPSDGPIPRDCSGKDSVFVGGGWRALSCNDFVAFACERESLPPLPNPLDILPDPHLPPAAQRKNTPGPGGITDNPNYTPNHDACGAGLDLITVNSGEMEFSPRLAYPPPPIVTTPGDPNCRVAYQECTINNQNPSTPSETDLNQDPPDTELCDAIADRAIEECGIDETTIDLSPQGLCSAHAQCVGRGFVCALVCTDAGCTTQEQRCAFPKPGCFGLLEEENCRQVRECAEPDHTGIADPLARQNQMQAHPPGNIDELNTGPIDPQPIVLGDYPPVTFQNVCSAKPDFSLVLPLQSEVRDINVGNEKWGLYVKPEVDWQAEVEPIALRGESRLDMLGEVGFSVGAYVWSKDVKLVNVGATGRLVDGCTMTFDRRVEVLGVAIDPGDEQNADFIDFENQGCNGAISTRSAKAGSMKQALHNAVAVKEYYEVHGATIKMCTKFKESFTSFPADCNTAAGRQAVVDYWFNLYEQLLQEVLDAQLAVENVRQDYVNRLPTARLPVLNQKRHFTAFNTEFTYPVGPATVTIEIEIGGSWGANGGLEMAWTPDPTTIKAAGSIAPTAEATAFAYAGIGFGPVSFGIAGELLLIGAQAPLLAEIGLQQAESTDTRDHRYFNELGLLPSPAFPPVKYQWKGTWAYGARPELHLLSGQIDLAARINLLFYKKTFRKKIADWNGIRKVWEFVADNGEAIQGNPDFGLYGEDLPFVNPASLRPLRTPSNPNLNTTAEPGWFLTCFAPPA